MPLPLCLNLDNQLLMFSGSTDEDILSELIENEVQKSTATIDLN